MTALFVPFLSGDLFPPSLRTVAPATVTQRGQVGDINERGQGDVQGDRFLTVSGNLLDPGLHALRRVSVTCPFT